MKPWEILTKLLLITLLALSASGLVNAKVASGPQNLGGAAHQGETVFNPLTHLAKTDISTTLTPGSPVVTKGGQKFLTNYSRKANLSQSRLEHIVERHWHSSGAKGAGKFSQDVGLKELRGMINDTVAKGSVRANTGGRPGHIFEHDFGSSIGTNIGGNAATRMRVVVGKDGNVVTAFPY